MFVLFKSLFKLYKIVEFSYHNDVTYIYVIYVKLYIQINLNLCL